jgi:hypothetical protein
MPVSSRARRLLLVATAFLGLAALVGLAERVPGSPMDLFARGHWLGIASDMLAGKVPYVDTFPVHGFLSDGGLDFLLFSFWRPSYSLSLAAHFLLGVLFQPCLFLVAAAGTRRPLLAVATIPLNLAIATQLVADRPVFPLLGLAAFLWALGHPDRRPRALLAGFLSGIGLLYALEGGTFVLAAEAGTLAIARLAGEKRPIDGRFFAAGLGLVLLPFAGYLALASALIAYLRVSFLDLPLQIHSIWGWQFPAPWTVVAGLLRGEPYRIGLLTVGWGVAKRLYLCPILGGLGLLLGLGIRRRRAHSPERFLLLRLIAVSLACLCFFRYVVARLHVEVGNALAGPLLLLILVAIYETRGAALAARERKVLAAALVLVGALSTLAMNGGARTFHVLQEAAQYTHRMADTEGMLRLSVERGDHELVPAVEAREVEALDAWTRRAVAADASILELTNRPALHFFLKRTNASRFYQVPLMRPFQADVIRQLEARPPAAVLLRHFVPYDTTDGIPNPAWTPELWQYVESHFPRRVQVGETLIALPEN